MRIYQPIKLTCEVFKNQGQSMNASWRLKYVFVYLLIFPFAALQFTTL